MPDPHVEIKDVVMKHCPQCDHVLEHIEECEALSIEAGWVCESCCLYWDEEFTTQSLIDPCPALPEVNND